MAGFTPAFRLALLGLGLVLAAPAEAQVETREGIALQNQILDLRRELDALRRGGGAVAPAPSAPARGSAASGDLVQQLLGRVQELEEENRRLRGRADVADNNDRQLRAEIEKLRGDLDFRLQALERGAGRPAAPRPPQPGPAAQAPAPAPSSAPRTAEKAITDGQAALARRDFPTAEAAAREAIRARPGARAQDASLLLGDALMGKRDFQNAALAYDEAYSRNRQGARAPEALIGLANAFQGFGARREACETLDNLRSNHPNLSGPLAERAADSRRRAQCR
ncbi:MAG: tetratricopeptide repeat protein, partial [Alphaproteobacteria bacterium]